MTSSCGVLLVDEDPYVRIVIGAELEASGRLVWATASADVAFSWAQSGAFDLALVDARATGFDAAYLARRIRLQCPDLPLAFSGPAGLAPSADFPIVDSRLPSAAFMDELREVEAMHMMRRGFVRANQPRPGAGPPSAAQGAPARLRSA